MSLGPQNSRFTFAVSASIFIQKKGRLAIVDEETRQHSISYRARHYAGFVISPQSRFSLAWRERVHDGGSTFNLGADRFAHA